MRLLSAHIENFGRLSDEDFVFEKGLNSIVRENGTGKSTLAAFIRIMLYGFDAEGKRSALENERKRYVPWQGGVYGGSLTIEVGDKNYRIERTFDEKKAAGDSFALYDADKNLPSQDYSDSIGDELFGVDAQSFRKTVFVGQLSCETEVTSGISAKIGNVSDDAMDMASYESAMTALKKELDSLTPNRKTGEINRLSREEALLDVSARGKDTLQHTIDEVSEELDREYAARDELKEKQLYLHEEIKKLGEINETKAAGERYLVLKENARRAKETLDREAEYFPGEIPDGQELSDFLRRSNDLTALKRDVENGAFSPDEAAQYERLSRVFWEGSPSDDEIRLTYEKLNRMEELREKSAYMKLSQAEEERLEGLENIFAEHMPDEAQIINLEAKWAERMTKKAALPAQEAAIRIMEQKDKGNGARLIIGVLISLIAAVISGVAAYMLYSQAAGTLALVAGGVFGVVFVVYYFVFVRPGLKAAASNDEYNELADRIEADREFIDRTDEEARNFLELVDIRFDEDTFSADIVRIQDMAIKYSELLRRKEEYADTLNDPQSRELSAQIRQFIMRYNPGFPADARLEEGMDELTRDCSVFEGLKSRHAAHKAASDRFYKEKNAILNYIEDMGFRMEADVGAKISDIRDHRLSYDNAKNAYDAAVGAVSAFEKENPELIGEIARIDEETDGNPADMEKLNRDFEELGKHIDECETNIRAYREQLRAEGEKLEKACNDEDKLMELREKKAALQRRFHIISLARKGLEAAYTEFCAKYMDPVKNAFDRYYAMISDDEKEYELDANLSLHLKEMGKNRELGFLSPGHRDAVGLCRRLAMADAMFDAKAVDSEIPFIILDDPFVNMDDAKLAGAKAFAHSIADDYQIIYLTCSKGRDIAENA